MATPFSQEARTLFRLLSDRHWHTYREIKDSLAATIAPGKALRKYEERVKRRREVQGRQPLPQEPTEDEKILYGARMIADSVIQGLKVKWLDVDNSGGGFGERHIRLKPTADVPGAAPPPPDGGPPPPPIQGWDEPVREPSQEAVEALEAEVEQDEADEPSEALRRAAEAPRAYERSGEGECPRCRMIVGDVGQHADWHAAMDAPPPKDEMALFSESEVRRIVAEEVGRQLDAFQGGFQQWLMKQLSGLDHTCELRRMYRRNTGPEF